MDEMVEKTPPQNIDAEQSVLGALLLQPESIYRVIEILNAQDFYRDGHRLIYETILRLNESGKQVDLITVTEELRRQGNLDKVGGAAYVASLSGFVPTAANIEHYARIVSEKAMLRQLIEVATRIAGMGYEGREDAERIIEEAERMIMELGGRKSSDIFSSIKDILLVIFERLEERAKKKGPVSGVPTEFVDLDRICSGLQPSDLIILAARPSMGKTTLGLNIAQQAALKHKIPVAVFSLEMSKEQLAQRMLCSEAMVDQHKLRTGSLDEEDWARLTEVAENLSSAPIYIDDTAGLSVREMRAKLKRLQGEKGLGLVVVDYLQLMRSTRRVENRQQEIADISRSLKGLAKELNVPVLALAQLSRAVEQRQDRRPVMSDLRESGSLEQDADVVMFIYRDEYYNVDSEKKGIAEIIIAKQRNGPVGKVELGFLKEYTRFVNLAKDLEESSMPLSKQQQQRDEKRVPDADLGQP